VTAVGVGSGALLGHTARPNEVMECLRFTRPLTTDLRRLCGRDAQPHEYFRHRDYFKTPPVYRPFTSKAEAILDYSENSHAEQPLTRKQKRLSNRSTHRMHTIYPNTLTAASLSSTAGPPNVKDEPRRQLARAVPFLLLCIPKNDQHGS
jgi:hypothetical protein